MTAERGYKVEDQSLTRPVVQGRELVVASGHYLASLAGMNMGRLGGNAVDAGVCMVFCQVLLESNACGFGGEVPMLIYSAKSKKVVAVNGNTASPKAATRQYFIDRGIKLIPGDGFLPAGVPAVPGALIKALSCYGNLSLAQVLGPAVELAEKGFPVYERDYRNAIVSCQKKFSEEWPSSHDLYMPGGRIPEAGELFVNKDLAGTFKRLISAEQANIRKGREAALKAAWDEFYKGDIASHIVKFQKENLIRDAGGHISAGLLTEEDFCSYETRIEEPLSVEYKGLTVHKTAPWSQGPVFLQQLNILKNFDISAMDPLGPEYVHTVVEASKLAFADREKYYGDPQYVDVPVKGLLSEVYAKQRSKKIDSSKASYELIPGNPYPYQNMDFTPDLSNITGWQWQGGTTGTRAVDSDGNMFSATPSGGWFPSSPTIKGLGFCLGTRCQMFWLGDPLHPNSLEPGKRPRTTLSPTLVTKQGDPYMVFGTPGGDNQDQWTLQFFLNFVDFGMNVQQAIDSPCFHSVHFPSSFYPRKARPGVIVIEDRFPGKTLDKLKEKGHALEISGSYSQGYTTAIIYDKINRTMMGGASSRYQTNYALGW